MTKVSSRFLAVLMLALLAFPGVMITSALAAGPLGLRSVRTIERTIERRYGPAIEDTFERYLGNRYCDLACRANSPIDAPLREKNSESGRWLH